jgi:hypothetical protein
MAGHLHGVNQLRGIDLDRVAVQLRRHHGKIRSVERLKRMLDTSAVDQQPLAVICQREATCRMLRGLEPTGQFGQRHHAGRQFAVPELWPSLSLLLELLEACPETTFSYKGDYARSLKTRLSGLVRAAGPALECFSGLDLFQHVLRAGKSCVLSMANMRPAWYRQFVTDLLVSQLLLGAVERRERTDRVRVLLIIEEADADVSQEAEQAYEDGLMPITEVFKTGREFGIGAYLSLSRPQSASQLISGNATTHFAFKVLDANATTRVRDTLMLGPDAGRLPATLRTGECLVRTFDWPHVFLAKVDHMPPCREAHVSYDEHPYQQALNLNDLPELRRDLQARSRKRNARKTKAPQPKQQPAKKSTALVVRWQTARLG